MYWIGYVLGWSAVTLYLAGLHFVGLAIWMLGLILCMIVVMPDLIAQYRFYRGC